jgi:uncharacterized protein
VIIGACSLELMIFESDSLKYKRHILKSIIERLKNRFNISIAEIDLNDSLKSAIIGFACVTNDTVHANKIINKVINFIDMDGRVEIIHCNIEIL